MEKKKLDTKQIRTGSDPLSQIKIKHQIASSQSVEKTIAKNPEAFPILKVPDFDLKTEESVRKWTEDIDAKGNSDNSGLKIPKPSLKFFGFQSDEYLKGENVIEYCENSSIILASTLYEGKLILTNYKLIFQLLKSEVLVSFNLRKEFLELPIMNIMKIEKYIEKKTNVLYLDVNCKDLRVLKFKIPSENVKEGEKLSSSLEFFRKKSDFVATEFNKFYYELDNKFKGWSVFQISQEFKRQGIDPLTMRPAENLNGNICSTYPETIYVPTRASDEMIFKSSRFRSRERLAILSYCYKQNIGGQTVRSYLFRASQCKSGLANVQRSPEDEEYLRVLGECSERGTLKIFDARPFWNAVGNMVVGKGYENKDNYKNCEISFLDIHNIHKVRDAYKKLMMSCLSNENSSKWFSQIETSNWISHIACILNGAIQVADSLRKHYSTLVHCSDGWDRTSQVLSLAQIIIDPYFRTIEGFIVLIEKDWVDCGHQFALRYGIGIENESQKSPVFIQFLDCVHQLMSQYPLSFQFNIRFLCEIATNILNGYFGTFLFDTTLDREKAQQKTVSLWSFILSQRSKYENPFYRESQQIEKFEIWPNIALRFLRIWKEHFLFFMREGADPYQIYPDTLFLEDTINWEHFRSQEERKLLKIRNGELTQDLFKLKKVLYKYEEKFGKLVRTSISSDSVTDQDKQREKEENNK